MSGEGPALAAALFLAAAFALRLAPRLLWPDLLGSDAYYHRAYVDLIRGSGHRVPVRHPRILGPGEFGYPALFHWLLSWLGPRGVDWVDRRSGAVLDLLAGGAVSTLLWRLGLLDGAGALAALACYLLAPGLTLFHIGPRAFSLTPRIFAQALYVLAFVVWLAAAAPALLDPGAAGALSALLLALMLLSSKFALQNLLFAAPVVLPLAGGAAPAWGMALAFPLAFLISGGFFWRQLRRQFDHLDWYVRKNREYVAHRANWRRIAEALKQRRLDDFAIEAFWHNPLLSGLARHLPLFLALLVAAGTARPLDEREWLALALALGALPPWLLTAFGPFRVLGESERYLEFAFPAAWFLLFALLEGPAEGWLLVGMALAFLAVYLVNLRLLQVAARRMGAGELDEVAAALRRFPRPVLLCLHDPESYRFLWEQDVRLCKYNGDIGRSGETGPFLDWLFWRYPHVHPDRLAEICARYDVDTLLLKRQAEARLRAELGRSYCLAGWEEAFVNDGYRLLRRKAQAAPC